MTSRCSEYQGQGSRLSHVGHGLPLVPSHAQCSEKQPQQQQTNKHSRALTLPVDQVRVGDHPGFQHPPELDVTLRGRQQLVVLVAARDVHLDLSIGRDGGVLVDALVFGLNVTLQEVGGKKQKGSRTAFVKTASSVCSWVETGFFFLHLDAE